MYTSLRPSFLRFALWLLCLVAQQAWADKGDTALVPIPGLTLPDAAAVCQVTAGTGTPDLLGGFWRDPARPHSHWYVHANGVQQFGLTWLTFANGKPIWLVVEPTGTNAQLGFIAPLYKYVRDPAVPGQPQKVVIGEVAARHSRCGQSPRGALAL